MKRVALLLLILVCSCKVYKEELSDFGYDGCQRIEIFQECLKNLPIGPNITKYNDWNEVVNSCDNVARVQSRRLLKFIKPECLLSNDLPL